MQQHRFYPKHKVPYTDVVLYRHISYTQSSRFHTALCVHTWLPERVCLRVFIINCLFWFGKHTYFFSCGVTAPSGPGPFHFRGFTIILRHTSLGRASLDEWSAWLRDLYLTTHDTHNWHTCPWRDSNPQSQQASGSRSSLRPRGHWDLYRQVISTVNITLLSWSLFNIFNIRSLSVTVVCLHFMGTEVTYCVRKRVDVTKIEWLCAVSGWHGRPNVFCCGRHSRLAEYNVCWHSCWKSPCK